MTNEEASEVINARLREFSNREHVDVELEEAMKVAIRALENKGKLSKKRTCPIDDQECHEAIDFDCKDCAIKKLNDFLLN